MDMMLKAKVSKKMGIIILSLLETEKHRVEMLNWIINQKTFPTEEDIKIKAMDIYEEAHNLK